MSEQSSVPGRFWRELEDGRLLCDVCPRESYCHMCGQLLIGRDWYVLSEWIVSAPGVCSGCGTKLPGLSEPEPGTWGARRLPVRLGAVGA